MSLEVELAEETLNTERENFAALEERRPVNGHINQVRTFALEREEAKDRVKEAEKNYWKVRNEDARANQRKEFQDAENQKALNLEKIQADKAQKDEAQLITRLRLVYMQQPGATAAQFEKNLPALLADYRNQQTLAITARQRLSVLPQGIGEF